MMNRIKNFGRGLKYWLGNYVLNRVPIHAVRVGWLRLMGARIDARASIQIAVMVFGPPSRLCIGAESVINPEVRLDARNGLEIGRNVSVSREAFILTLGHDYDDPGFALKGARVVVEDNVWIGIRATVMPGVRLGAGSVIAANATVTRNTEPWGVYAGTPARKIGDRRQQEYASVYYRPFFGAMT
jgi:acetyltransferase-like isoleucine patch superfamily enzyme